MNVPENFPNYTGPYISDGKFQSSVEFGQTPPKDALDAISRLHDSAYAHWDDSQHRRAADIIYAKEAAKIDDSLAGIAGFSVLYGNQILRSTENLLGLSTYPTPLNLVKVVYGGAKNLYDLIDYVQNERRYQQDVREFYDIDPGWMSTTAIRQAEVVEPFLENYQREELIVEPDHFIYNNVGLGLEYKPEVGGGANETNYIQTWPRKLKRNKRKRKSKRKQKHQCLNRRCNQRKQTLVQ
jgi:hypothetical protein